MLRSLSKLFLPLLALAMLIAPARAAAQASQPTPAAAPTGTVLRGDVNGDGQVTVLDALAVIAYVVGKELPAEYQIFPNGDADGNGHVTTMDALVIAGYAMGRDVSRWPVGTAIQGARTDGLLCAGSVRDLTVTCRSQGPQPQLPSGVRGTVAYGGQGLYVRLASANVAFNSGTRVFSFDARLVNLLPVVIGEDSTGAATRTHIYFSSLVPAVDSVVNADTALVVTAPNQPAFRYSGKIAAGDSAAAKTWQIHLATGQENFTFVVYVSTDVKNYKGYVDIYPKTDTIAVGQTVQLTDTVRNHLGVPRPGVPVAWSSSNPAAATIDASTGLVTAVADGTTTITARSVPEDASIVHPSGTATIVVATASADSTKITPAPSSLAAGDTSTLTVQVRTFTGVNYTHSAGTVVLAASAGTLKAGASTGASVTAVDNGNGTYTAKLTRTGVGIVNVSGTLNGVAIHDTAHVTFTAAAAANMAVHAANPQTGTAGQNAGSPPGVLVTDTYGNPVSGVVVKFKVTLGGGKLSNGGPAADSVNVTTAANGIATVTSWTLGTVAGSNTNQVVASSTGLTSVTFTASTDPGAAASMVKSAGDAQSDTVGTAVSTAPAVTITDSYGNVVPGVMVHFTVTSGGGAVVPDSVATNASGVAAVTSWTLGNTAGANTLDAAHTGLTTVTFTATGTPDVPANITKTSTDPQSGTVGVAVGSPPAVHVTDQHGNPVPGVTVTFAVTGGGGSTTGASPSTNASGNATIGSWTPGSTAPGPNTLSATASGGSNPSTTFTVYVPPVAANDSSQAMGNTTLASGNAPNVLANDAGLNGAALSVTTTGALATVRGGTVNLAAGGTFDYTPPAGNVLRDSVQYTAGDGHATTSAYIKIRFVGKVWYVDNTFGGSPDGRNNTPFTSVGAAATAAGTNDSILVRPGSGTTGGGTLKAGQLVYGAGASSAFTTTLNGSSVTLLATGAAPSIGALTLGSGNTLRGFTGVGTITGNSFGTLTVSEVGLSTGGTQALSLTTGTLSGGFTSLVSSGGTNNVLLSGVATSGTATLGAVGNALSGATGDAVVVSGGAGSFTFPGNVSNAASFAVNVNGKTGGTVTFSGGINPSGAARGISVTGNNSGANVIAFSGSAKNISSGTAAGVVLSNNTGASISFTGGGLAIATTTGTPFSATGGGTVEVTGSGNTVSATGAAANAVNLNGVTLGSNGVTFASISSSGTTTGSAFVANTVGNTSGSSLTAGPLTVAGTTGASSRGLELASNSAPFTFTTVSVNGTGGEGIYLNGNTGAVSVNGGTVGNTSSTTGDALFVSGGNAGITIAASLTKTSAGRVANIGSHTAGSVTISGNLSCTVSCTGVNVPSNSGGTIDFSAGTKTLTTGANAAVTVSSNTGATVNFSNGGLAITTTSGAGFNATGGGTVTVTGNNNTISSGTGTALNVSSTTIGANGLTFRSIGASGGSNGIVLSSTGSSGGLTVTGDGVTNGSGGTITNMTGGDGASAGNGVYLSSAQKVNLSWMSFSGSQNNGIFGTAVRGGFTLNHVRFTGTTGNSSSGTFDESPVHLVDAGGPIKMTNSRFDGGAYNAVLVENISGTAPAVDSLVLDTDTVTSMQGSTSDVRSTALLVNLSDGTADVRIRNNFVTAWWGNGIHVLSQGTASSTARITNNIVDNQNGALAGAGGIWVGGGNLAYNISGNTVKHTNGTAISAGRVNQGTNMNGTIDSNTIGVSGDTNSGSGTGIAIFAEHHGSGVTTVKISNNTIRQIAGSANGAITTHLGDDTGFGASGTLNATVTGNSIAETGSPTNNAQQGMFFEAGAVTGDNDSICLDVGGAGALKNTITNFNTTAPATSQNRIRVNQRFVTTVKLPGYTGTGGDNTAVQTYILGRNTISNALAQNTSSTYSNTSPAGSACPQPTM
jgi:hypothetical protein